MRTELLLAAAAACFAYSAQAQSIDASGVGKGTAMSEVMQVSESLTVVRAASEYTGFETDAADNPMSSLSGPCFGAILIKEGSVNGGGMCNYTDGDGDAVVMHWEPDSISEDGRTQGTWMMVAGTGKWDGMSGSGRFDAGTDADGIYTNKVTGEISR